MTRDFIRRFARYVLSVGVSMSLLAPTAAVAEQKAGNAADRAKPAKVSADGNGMRSHTARPGQISLRHVDSWGYQLQNVRPRVVTKDGLDLLVVDYSRDGTAAAVLTPAEVDLLRKRTREPDRIILAYLSIGEAEDYRFYWHAGWSEKPSDTANTGHGFAGASNGVSVGVPEIGVPRAKLTSAAPAWLADENPSWRGNYLVRYWDANWQALIFGSPAAYLDRIIEAGFDGVYFDKIDSNDDWQKIRPTSEREMVDFVKAIASYARRRHPNFLIVPQNGEDLLAYRDYVDAIDAIAKEDLLYGGASRKDGEPNPEPEISRTKALLDRARRAKKLVLTVEYLDEIEAILTARKRMRSYDYVPFFARRTLGEAPLFPPPRSSLSNGDAGGGKTHD